MKEYIHKITQRRSGKVALVILGFFTFLFIFADFIANERPLVCQHNEKIYFPVFHQIGEQIGIVKEYSFLATSDWQTEKFDWAVHPPVSFDPKQLHIEEGLYRPPGHVLKDGNRKFLLGSDRFGRDVLSGLIHATRFAFLIGLFSVIIATFIGVVIGAFTGYCGDDRLHFYVPDVIIGLSVLFFGSFYVACRSILGLGVVALCIGIYIGLIRSTVKRKFRFYRFPLDLMIMRFVEIFDAIPSLFLLLLIMAMVEGSSVIHIILILGGLTWISKVRLMRAEALKIRNSSFVLAAESYGLPVRKIVMRHIIPNAIQPLIIKVAFAISVAILLETSISFLGLGLGLEEVTWGSQLSDARRNFEAWWLVVFPGMCVFLVVYAFNSLGDCINDIQNPYDK